MTDALYIVVMSAAMSLGHDMRRLGATQDDGSVRYDCRRCFSYVRITGDRGYGGPAVWTECEWRLG